MSPRYTSVTTELIALDHQGHGRSTGKRHYVQDFVHYVDEYLDLISRLKGNAPLYLMGHQTGARFICCKVIYCCSCVLAYC